MTEAETIEHMTADRDARRRARVRAKRDDIFDAMRQFVEDSRKKPPTDHEVRQFLIQIAIRVDFLAVIGGAGRAVCAYGNLTDYILGYSHLMYPSGDKSAKSLDGDK